jgi:hypothetical protein
VSQREKVCIECGVRLPATTEYFHRSKDGFHARCRTCRNRVQRTKRKDQHNKKLDEIERGAIKYFTAAARIGGASIPHSSELLEVLMEYFGGVRGFANAFMKQYYDSPIGGAFRTKMLDTVSKLVTANTAMGGAKKPLELMTEEELESELRRQVLEAAAEIRKIEVVDEVRKLPVVERDTSGELGGVQEISTDLGPERGGAVPKSPLYEQLRRVDPEE